ncbi:unnamed protein product [Rotaria socialis]|uniref:Uncharacterized protein n=2 Tax=Rotaria socialis TaxID=392032 RepID=A0A818GER0_9BILA|nr:unnamed protein product [Rotaria socialis]
MRRKRTFRKNVNLDQNKENLNESNQSNLQILEEKVQNQQVSNDPTNNLIDDSNLATQDDFNKILSPFSMSNEIESMDLFDENLNLTEDLPLDNNQGQKRSLSDPDSNEHSKRSSPLNDLLLTDLIELKEKVSQLEARIKEIEDGSMSLLKPSKISQNMSEMTNVLVNDEENKKADRLLSIDDIKTILNMDEKALSSCNRKTETSTARFLIKLFCRNSDTTFEYVDVDKSIISSIIGYTKQSNPDDLSSDSDRRRAISNYFAYVQYKEKHK